MVHQYGSPNVSLFLNVLRFIWDILYYFKIIKIDIYVSQFLHIFIWSESDNELIFLFSYDIYGYMTYDYVHQYYKNMTIDFSEECKIK